MQKFPQNSKKLLKKILKLLLMQLVVTVTPVQMIVVASYFATGNAKNSIINNINDERIINFDKSF